MKPEFKALLIYIAMQACAVRGQAPGNDTKMSRQLNAEIRYSSEMPVYLEHSASKADWVLYGSQSSSVYLEQAFSQNELVKIDVDWTDMVSCISHSLKSMSFYVGMGHNAVAVVSIASKSVTHILRFEHPILKEYLVTRVLSVLRTDGVEYLVVSNEYSTDIVFLDPAGQKLPTWVKTGDKPIKRMAASSRNLIAMTEDGTEVVQVDLYSLVVAGRTTNFASPGYALYAVDYYAMFPDYDLFLMALSNGNRTTSYILFDGSQDSMRVMKDYGSGVGVPVTFSYIPNTHSIISCDNKDCNLIDLRTNLKSTVNLSKAFRLIHMIGNSSYLTMISSTEQKRQIIQLTNDIGEVGCFEGCGKCNIIADSKSCSECMPGYSLNTTNGSKCMFNCQQGEYFNSLAKVCTADIGIYNYLQTSKITNFGIGDCMITSPLRLACLECGQSLKPFQDQCISTPCPPGFFQGYNRVCYPCHKTCSTCTGKEENQCDSCADRYRQKDGRCVTECSAGYFSDISRKRCNNCYTGCDECYANDPIKCRKCIRGMYLNGGFCFAYCPQGFVSDDDSGLCEICKGSDCPPCAQGKMYYRGRCYNSCPQNTGSHDNKNCLDCYDYKCRLLSIGFGLVVDAKTGNPADPNDDGDESLGPAYYAGAAIASILFITVCLLLIIWGIYMIQQRFCTKKRVPTFQDNETNAILNPELPRSSKAELTKA